MTDWKEKNAQSMLTEVYSNHKNLEEKFDKLDLRLFGKDGQGGAIGKIETMFNGLNKKFASKWTEKLIACTAVLWVIGQILNNIELVKALTQ